jgi:hypothetical protein
LIWSASNGHSGCFWFSTTANNDARKSCREPIDSAQDSNLSSVLKGDRLRSLLRKISFQLKINLGPTLYCPKTTGLYQRGQLIVNIGHCITQSVLTSPLCIHTLISPTTLRAHGTISRFLPHRGQDVLGGKRQYSHRNPRQGTITPRNSEESLKQAVGLEQSQRNDCGAISTSNLTWPTRNRGCRFNWILQK